MLEQLAGDLELVLLRGELRELAVDDFLPRSRLVRAQEGVDLGQREPNLAKEADDTDRGDGC